MFHLFFVLALPFLLSSFVKSQNKSANDDQSHGTSTKSKCSAPQAGYCKDGKDGKMDKTGEKLDSGMCSVNGKASIKGEKGSAGQKGEKGQKGMPGTYHGLVPAGLKLKPPLNTQEAIQIVKATCRRLVKAPINDCHRRLKRHRNKLRQLHDQLKQLIPTDLLDTVTTIADKRANKTTEHQQKLTRLLRDKEERRSKPDDNWVSNISSRSLDKTETRVLSYGLKHSVTPKRIPTEAIVSSVEAALSRQRELSEPTKDNIRSRIASTIQSTSLHDSNLTKDEQRALKRLRNDENIVILPADKGRVTVVMDKTDYHDKMDALVNDKRTYEELKRDPTPALQQCSTGFHFFVKVQDLPTRGAAAVQQFIINRSLFLAFGNYFGDIHKYKTNSMIYKMDETTGKFTLNQTLQTRGAYGVEYFFIADKHFLANRWDGTILPDSVVYQWNGRQFSLSQKLPTKGTAYFKFFTMNGEKYLTVGNYLLDKISDKWRRRGDQSLLTWLHGIKDEL
ncbi:Thrombospondin-type laminin G domain and EAR repeat-containing protein [Stylophora pistillata]|uniref:Thrombospondin-type laminin G domain and EAR repeat-containing protein n=1 Tax=Stylophora pistillata TaxID=50429 RepID=A0A2B4SH56_STYPI|nr:Thrombospondin-type laminin G domain and EAR repeat-containing protein [Stylophora pistillata]